MWKSASRSLKSRIEKCVLRPNTVLSTDALQCRELQASSKFSPFLLQHCSRFYNFYKGTTQNFTKENKEGPKEKKNSFLESFDNPFVDALKWSGIFAFAYFTFLQYKFRGSYPFETYEDYVIYRTPYYQKIFKYVANVAGIKPYNCVLPEVHAIKSEKSKQQLKQTSTKDLESEEKNFTNLEKAHKKVLGAVNNFLGTQCMQSGHHKDAFEYFMKSAEEEHASGIFNLGICHEKGLGTGQNLEMAAELYQRAAELGHATAMYNLGVFYAQGRGQIQADVNQARKLFEAAARVGQIDAIKALNLEKQAAEDPSQSVFISKDVNEENTQANIIYSAVLEHSDSFKQFSDCDSEVRSHCHSFEIPFKEKEINSSDNDSGVLDLSPTISVSMCLCNS